MCARINDWVNNREVGDLRRHCGHYDVNVMPLKSHVFIMSATASQIIGVSIVYPTVYSDADKKKHQNSASLAFVRGIHRSPVDSLTKGQWRGKYFHLITSSCHWDVVPHINIYQWNWPSWVRLMTYHPICRTFLPEPMRTYFQLDSSDQITMRLESIVKTFH